MGFKLFFMCSSFGALLLAILYPTYIWKFSCPAEAIDAHGVVDPKFKKVQEAFKENLEKDLGYGGGAVSVFYHGKEVVNIWGGYSDYSIKRLWKKDTISMFFSCTKAVAALCLAKLVDKGYLDYDALVVKYWPEFGQNGKENITVKILLSHQAGLVVLSSQIKDPADEVTIKKQIEISTPMWPAGTAVGYHLISYGFICNQLMRLVDPKKRNIGTFFQEEIAKPFDIDYYIGLPYDQYHRAGRISSKETFLSSILEFLDSNTYHLALSRLDSESTISKAFGSIEMKNSFHSYFNDPDLWSIDMSSGNGIGSAHALAKLYNYLLTGEIVNGTELLSKKTLNRLLEPVCSGWDLTLNMENVGGYGFWYFPNPKKERTLFGHHGIGGQMSAMDRKRQMSLAVSHVYMSADIHARDPRYLNLLNAIYECMDFIESNKS